MAAIWGKRKSVTWQQKLLNVVRSPAAQMLAVSLAVLAFCIVFIGHLRPFNSDDLYWQQAVRTWRPFNGQTFYFGTKDIFELLGPLFAVMGWIFPPSRRLLIVETVLLTGGSFTLVYLSALYFMRKLRIRAGYLTLLPFVWLASFGYPLVQNYLNSNWRTFQLGFSFGSFVLVAAFLNGDIRPLRSVWTRVLTGVGIVLSGALMYGDPYYTIVTAGPVVLFAGGLYLIRKIKRQELLYIYGAVALSYVVSKMFAVLCARAGIHIVGQTPSVFVGFEQIVSNVLASVHGLYIIFGADFLGRNVTAPSTLGAMVNAAVLTFILYLSFKYRRLARAEQATRADLAQLWAGFLAGVMLLVFLVYTSSSLAADSNNYRFYIMFVYCAVTLLAITLGLMRSQTARQIVGGLLVLATLYNLGYTIKDTKHIPDVSVNRSNQWNYALINAVESRGFTKGYASYWDGNVNTYLSNNKVAFLPSLCGPDGVSAQFRWLVDGGQFDRPASQSFYVLDPDFPSPGLCNPDQLEAQFGAPQDAMQVGDKTILLYGYDITSRMRKVQY